MRRGRKRVVAPAMIGVIALGLATVAIADRSDRASLATVEGVVVAVDAVRDGETGIVTTAVRLRPDDPQGRETFVLLAPSSALVQSGFEVATGDLLRARVFLSGDEAVEAHKVMNISRGTMVRLRTLHGVPLWDGNGQWHGGPSRLRGGGGHGEGPRHGGGGRGPR